MFIQCLKGTLPREQGSPQTPDVQFSLVLQKICWGTRTGCPASGHLGSMMGLFKIQPKT